MFFVQHRVNTIRDLHSFFEKKENNNNFFQGYGCEIDLRSHPERSGFLHLAHDPWKIGESFEDWAQEYKAAQFNGPLILNTKEDGLENRILEILKHLNVENFFFLDTTIPTLARKTLEGEHKFAVRCSRFEPLNSTFQKRAHWLWMDCFDGIPMPISEWHSAKENFQVCLVSPELHGKPLDVTTEWKLCAQNSNAICSKHLDQWCSALQESGT